MRTSILSLSLLALPLIAACGDDGKDNVDAPPPIDMPDVDAPPDAHVFGGFDANEGGEVRAEYTIFPNDARATRVTAFAYQDAGTKKFFSYVDENGCTDISTAALKALHWPTAQNPTAERVYHDLGSVTITATDDSTTLDVPRAETGPARDPFFRDHPAGDWFFKQFPLNANNMPGGVNDDMPYTAEKTAYDVKFGGSTDLPEQTFDGALYMPAAFSIAGDTTHPHAAIFAPADTAQTFTWTTPADSPTNGTEILGLVAVTGPMGPAFLCIEPNDGGADGVAGSITVPAAMINIARTTYPTAGDGTTSASLARQTLSHAVRELQENDGPSGKRVDIIGVWCFAGTKFFTTQPAVR
jgi:hypothetical protein